MKNSVTELGYHYSPSLKTIILGYRDANRKLHGKVIGHTCDPYWGHAFSFGYTYNSWHEGFIYVARLKDYYGLKNYLNYLQAATTEQIEAYFLIKEVIKSRHLSYIQRRQIDGRTIKYLIQKLS